MNEQEFLLVVSETKAEIEPFIELALKDSDLRDVLVKHLINNNAINIYYHSYEILKKSSSIHPNLFYCYWDSFATLLQLENSYHRNYGMDLIANLVCVDTENRFELIFDDYYKQLNDEKISTKKYCIYNSARIIKVRPDLTSKILTTIIDSLKTNSNTEAHQNLLLSEFLNILLTIEIKLPDNIYIIDFLTTTLQNTNSDKIKREIKKFKNKYGIQTEV